MRTACALRFSGVNYETPFGALIGLHFPRVGPFKGIYALLRWRDVMGAWIQRGRVLTVGEGL